MRHSPSLARSPLLQMDPLKNSFYQEQLLVDSLPPLVCCSNSRVRCLLQVMDYSISFCHFYPPRLGVFLSEEDWLDMVTFPRNVVGFLGYNHDRQLALKALAVSAARSDVHAVFSGYAIAYFPRNMPHVCMSRLVLMTYYGVVLLMSGYQADERHIISQYKGIVQRWILLLLCLVEHVLTVPYQGVRAISKGFSMDTQQGGRVSSLIIIRLTLPRPRSSA